MYLNIMNNKKTGKTTLSIRRGYRENGKVKHKTVQTLGTLDVLKQQYDDPISYFKEIVRQMNEEEKLKKAPLTLTIDKNEKMVENTDNNKNFGYVALSKIYHELEIDKFIKNKFKERNFSEYKINNIMKLLVLLGVFSLTLKNQHLKIKTYFLKTQIFL